ncbi:MAG: Lrp/AsnC family transcriptional regulator [Actinobacteria bacterium]|nr:MAG: Lrp/AsnC family transcriptional regulator [Actinomycetota bacterium]
MTHAVVLIEAERDAMSRLGGELADIDGVAEAYSVTGEWDFVAIVRVPRHEQLADVVTGQITQLPGVSRTQTMVAFEAFSRHDLEALFSIGG